MYYSNLLIFQLTVDGPVGEAMVHVQKHVVEEHSRGHAPAQTLLLNTTAQIVPEVAYHHAPVTPITVRVSIQEILLCFIKYI
jgi:hypothetical protein